jgi:hypothetical protein
MQGRGLLHRLVLVVVLSQALVLHGLAGAWAKAAGVPESHGASGYLCAPSGSETMPAQPFSGDPADEGSTAHSDCLFMCTAAGAGSAMLPAQFAWFSHRFVTTNPVPQYLSDVAMVHVPGAMPARGPPSPV